MRKGAMEYINYGEYDVKSSKIKVIKGVNEFYNHTINSELLGMLSDDWYWSRMGSGLITKNHISMGTVGTQDTIGAYIPRSLLDHTVVKVLSYEHYTLPILFSFPYQSIKRIKEHQEEVSEVWRLYWVNPKFFKYNLDAPGFCFVFNNEFSDDVIYIVNEYFYMKYGEHLWYMDDYLTIGDLNNYPHVSE